MKSVYCVGLYWNLWLEWKQFVREYVVSIYFETTAQLRKLCDIIICPNFGPMFLKTPKLQYEKAKKTTMQINDRYFHPLQNKPNLIHQKVIKTISMYSREPRLEWSPVSRIWGIAWWGINIYLVCDNTMCVSTCQVEFVLIENRLSLFYYRFLE